MRKSSLVLVRNTLFYTVAALIPKLAGVVLMPIYANCMTPEDFGITGAMASLTLLLEVTLTLSLGRGIFRLYWDQQTESDRRRYLGTIAAFIVGFGGLATLLLTTLAAPALHLFFPSIPFRPYYVLTVVTAYLTMMSQQPLNVARLHQRADLCVWASLLDLVIRTVAIIVCVVRYRMGAYGMVLGLFLAALLQTPVYAFFNLTAIRAGLSLRMLWVSLQFCLPMIPSLATMSLASTVNRSFLDRYSGLAAIGLFTIANRLTSLTQLVVQSLQQAYQPLFYELAAMPDEGSARPQIHRGHALYLFASLACLAITALLLPAYVALFFKPKYAVAQAIVPVMTVRYLAAVPSKLLNFSIYMRKKSFLVAGYDMATAVLNVALNYWMVPHFGLQGACWATSLAFLLPIPWKYRLSNQCYPLGFPWQPVLGCYVLTGVVFAVLGLFSGTLDGEAFLLRAVLLALLLWVYALAFLRTIGAAGSYSALKGLLGGLRNPRALFRSA